jgi:hypothetical protein
MFTRLFGLKPSMSQYGVLLLIACCAFTSSAKTAVPVFLLSGQSNMSGYASANDLTADQKQTVPNAKIYVDMTWENNGKLKQWLTLGPGFGSSANNIGPELYIGRTLSEKLPNTKIALIKVCCGSTYLGNYPSKPNDCFVPPSSNNGTAGPHYKRLLSATETALKSFNAAFDTAQYTPCLAGFVWLQGEFDGQVKALADAYKANLTCLINDVRKDFKVDDLPSIIIMIDVQNSWQYNSIIRAAEVAVTESLKNVDTLDTKGYQTDGTHYKAQGQVKIGTVTAERWFAMDYDYGQKVPIVHRYSTPSVVQHQSRAAPITSNMLFDLSGKRIMPRNGTFDKMPFGLFIAPFNQPQTRQRGVQIAAYR